MAKAHAPITEALHDPLFGGRPFRISRESPLLEAAFSVTDRDVAVALDRYVRQRGVPSSITVDHGAEFMSKALEEWVYRHGVRSH